MEKAKGNKKALWLHALIVGGWSGAVAGLIAGGLVGLLAGFVIGAVSHWWVDSQNKWGIKDWRKAISADQAAHLAALIVISML